MATPKDITEIKSSLVDLQSGMRWIYRMVGTSVNSSRTVAVETNYISNKLGCHASRIDDNTRDPHELMGKVYIVKEDVQNLTRTESLEDLGYTLLVIYVFLYIAE